MHYLDIAIIDLLQELQYIILQWDKTDLHFPLLLNWFIYIFILISSVTNLCGNINKIVIIEMINHWVSSFKRKVRQSRVQYLVLILEQQTRLVCFEIDIKVYQYLHLLLTMSGQDKGLKDWRYGSRTTPLVLWPVPLI